MATLVNIDTLTLQTPKYNRDEMKVISTLPQGSNLAYTLSDISKQISTTHKGFSTVFRSLG